jgi:hypothetical protein
VRKLGLPGILQQPRLLDSPSALPLPEHVHPQISIDPSLEVGNVDPVTVVLEAFALEPWLRGEAQDLGAGLVELVGDLAVAVVGRGGHLGLAVPQGDEGLRIRRQSGFDELVVLRIAPNTTAQQGVCYEKGCGVYSLY